MAGFAKGLIHGGLIGSAGVLALALAVPPAGDSVRMGDDGAQVADDAARVTQGDSGEAAGAIEAGTDGVGGLESGGSVPPSEASDPALASGETGDDATPAQGAVVEFAAPRGSEFARPDPHRLPSLPADAAPPETGRRAALPDAPEAEPAPVSPDRADPPVAPAIPGPLPEAVAQSYSAPAPQAGEDQATPRTAAPALAAAPGSDAALPPETAQSPAPPEPSARTEDPQATPPAGQAAEPALPQAVVQGETPRADSPALVQVAPDEAVPADETAARPGDIGTAPAMPQIGASAGGDIPQLPSGGSAPQRSAAPQLDSPRPVVETVPPPPPAADETAASDDRAGVGEATPSQGGAGGALSGSGSLPDTSENGRVGAGGVTPSQGAAGDAPSGRDAGLADTPATGTGDQQPADSTPRRLIPRPVAPDLTVPHLNGLGL